MKRDSNPAKRTTIGGQALLEGVMMRGVTRAAMAVRLPDGEIHEEYLNDNRTGDRHPVLKWPILRGVVGLVESLLLGMRAMTRSAEFAATEEDEEPAADASAPTASATESDTNSDAPAVAMAEPGEKPEEKESRMMSLLMTASSVLGFALAIALFLWLPSVLFFGVKNIAGSGISPYRALIEGIIKIIIFLLYLCAISLMPSMKRVFMYHGAEHKTIFCYENALPLTVENARTMRRFHPRCGTSFLLLMLVVSIVLWQILYLIFPPLQSVRPLYMVPLKVISLPLLVGFGFELIRLCGRHDNILTRAVAAPGLWMQRITTKEPDDSMLEVAIRSMEMVLPAQGEDDNW